MKIFIKEKKNPQSDIVKLYSKNKSVFDIVEKENEICASFALCTSNCKSDSHRMWKQSQWTGHEICVRLVLASCGWGAMPDVS